MNDPAPKPDTIAFCGFKLDNKKLCKGLRFSAKGATGLPIVGQLHAGGDRPPTNLRDCRTVSGADRGDIELRRLRYFVAVAEE